MPRYADHLDNADGTHTRATLSIRLVLTGGAAAATRTFDLDALAVTQGEVRSIPANAKVIGAHLECEQAIAFTGTTTGYAMVVGITGTTNGFLATGSLVGLTAGQTTDIGGPGTLVNRIRANTAPALEAVGTVSGGAAVHTEVSAGIFWVHLEYVLAKGRV